MANITSDFAQFPFDDSVQLALKKQGFNSIYDILVLDETRFRQQYDVALNGYAGAIYQQAKNYQGMADKKIRQQWLPIHQQISSLSASTVLDSAGTLDSSVAFAAAVDGDANDLDAFFVSDASGSFDGTVSPFQANKAKIARYAKPFYHEHFSDDHSRFVEPGSLHSLDSPVSYLVYLLSFLQKISHPGSNALQALLTRRRDLGEMLLDEHAFSHSLPTSELVWEIMRDAFKSIKEVNDVDYYLAKEAIYPLTLPFDVAQTRIALALEEAGLSLGDAFSTLSTNYRVYSSKQAAMLAWSNVSAGLYDELLKAAPAKSLPVIVQFDDKGRGANGETPFLLLANLWPGVAVQSKEYQIENIEVTCAAIKKTANPSVKFNLTFTNPTDPQEQGKGVSVRANSIISGQLVAKELYWGIANLTVTAVGLPTRTISIGVLIGDTVGSEKASLDAFSQEANLLKEYLGPDIASAVAAQMHVPVEMLCQAAGISAGELQEAFALGDFAPHVATHLLWNNEKEEKLVAGVYGARYLWGNAYGLEGELPGTIHENEIKTTIYQLNRLQKLIRLHHVTDLPYAELDWLITAALAAQKENVTNDISQGVVRTLGVYERFHLAYELSAEQVAALIGDISPYAVAGKAALLDSVLAAAGQNANFKVPLTGGEEFSPEDIASLAQAFAVPAATLLKLTKDHSIKKSLSGISALYRLSLLAECFKLSVDNLIALVEMVCGSDALKLLITPCIHPDNEKQKEDTLDLLMTLDEVVSWAKQQKLPLAEIAAFKEDNTQQKALVEALKQAWSDWLKKDKVMPAIASIESLLKVLPTFSEEFNSYLELSTILNTLATIISQHTHLDPGAAWALMVFQQKLLDKVLQAPDPLTVPLTPLLLTAGLIQFYKLDDVALTPLLAGNAGINSDSPPWLLHLALSDFAQLALGDERGRPVALCMLNNDERHARLAQLYQIDLQVLADVDNDGFSINNLARLQRLMAFAKNSGWSLGNLLALLKAGALSWRYNSSTIEAEWAARLQLSQQCGSRKAAERKALDNKLVELRNKAMLAHYKSTCRRLTIELENKTWSSAFAEHEPDTIDVAGQLLIDPEMTSKVPTSRVAEAIASVQAFIQRIAEGRESEWQLTAGELQRWRDNDSRYAVWAANVQLRWHPDQYINPAARQYKTPSFSQFESRLSQARLDKDSVEDAITDYLRSFEQVVNLNTIGAYQDGISSSQSPIYFLGRSPHAPFEYYFRRWGIDNSGLRRWSAWEKIELPTTNNVMATPDPTDPGYPAWINYINAQQDKRYLPVQARLVVLNGRLYFIWVEVRVVTPEHMVAKADKSETPPAGNAGNPFSQAEEPRSDTVKKKYRHVISLVHRHLDGGWSIPIEIYQGPPVEYLDPAPNLAAFTIPEHAAKLETITYKKDIPTSTFGSSMQTRPPEPADSNGNSVFKKVDGKNKFPEGEPLFKVVPEIKGDMLLVSLLSVATDPGQENAISQYWLFDSFLNEVRTSPRADKDSAQRLSYGLGLDYCDPENQIVKTIKDLNQRSYFYVHPAGKDNQTDHDTGPYSYSSQVLTPCIPEHWLFSQRQWLSRGEAIFGNALKLALKVVDAGQSGRDSYQTISTISLTQEQFDKVPRGSKLVHFLSLQGAAKYQVVTNTSSEVSLFTRYPSGPISSGELYHGVMLLPDSSSNVVAIEDVDNALIEYGQLAVAHVYVEQLGAEICENAQGVQYLVVNYLDGQETSQPEQSIHGTLQAGNEQTVPMPHVAFKLLVGVKGLDNKIAEQLKKQDDWMSADFFQKADGKRISQWSYDVPREESQREQVWLVTRVEKEKAAQLNGLTLPSDIKVYHIVNDNLVGKTLADLKSSNSNETTYLFRQITGFSDKENVHVQNCDVPSADFKTFSPMEFSFLLTDDAQKTGETFTPTGIKFRVMRENELREDITHFTAGTTVFTTDDWGWMEPTFSTNTHPYTLNRSYRLPSAACHYFLIKVDPKAFDIKQVGSKFVGLDISVTSALNLPIYVVGLKGEKAEQIEINATNFLVKKDNSIRLQADRKENIENFLKQYSVLFFALPWTANSFADVQRYGLRFNISNLKGQETLPFYIPCEVPTLAMATITSSCSPAQASIGDVVQISASINLGNAQFSAGANLVIELNEAYELLMSGMSAPAGVTVEKNQIKLNFLPGQREAQFNLPVRVLEGSDRTLPLATLTVADKRSSERVLLAQPEIFSTVGQQLKVSWNWLYGADANQLLTSSTEQPITQQMVTQNYVLSALTLTPQFSGQVSNVEVTFTLPEGVTVDKDINKFNVLNKDQKFATGALALGLASNWQESAPDTDGKTTVTFSHLTISKEVTLVLPLLFAKTQKQFNPIEVTVIQGVLKSNVWQAKSYPMWQAQVLPAGDAQVAVSAGCDPVTHSGGYLFGDKLDVFLLIKGIKDTPFTKIDLHLAHQFSYSDGNISYSIFAADNQKIKEAKLQGNFNTQAGNVTIPFDQKLLKDQQCILKISVDAIPYGGSINDNTTSFNLFTAGDVSLGTTAINLGNSLLNINASVNPVDQRGLPILAGTTLPVGATFTYRVSVNLSAEMVKMQYGDIAQSLTYGPLLTLILPKSLALVKNNNPPLVELLLPGEKVHLPSGTLPVLTKEEAAQLMNRAGALPQNMHYGVFAQVTTDEHGKVDGVKVTAQTKLLPDHGLVGEFEVHVQVIESGSIAPSFTINPNNSSFKKLTKVNTLSSSQFTAPLLVAYDANKLPYTDLHFAQVGASGFTDPIPQQKPALLAATGPKKSKEKRLVRLNSQFGQELVRIGQRNVDAVFLAATQDHPLPPMEPGTAPEPLEQDEANLLYFWELFYHVPALIAYKLNAEGRYDEAQDWLHNLMDPFPTLENGRKKPIWRCRLLTADFSYVSLDNTTGPIDPDVIASVQPEFYRRATFFAYVQNLFDKGDSYYRELSRDGFNSAHQCYLLIGYLLGTQFTPSRVPKWQPMTAKQMVDEYGAASAGTPGAVFALPRSKLYQSLVKKLQQRLFNIRNGLTLDGKPLDLPLYDPPLDPAQLLAARVGGSISASNLLGTRATPMFRYNTLYARTSAAVEIVTQFGNTLLSLLDRQQDLRYQSLLINQQKEMATFVISQQKETIKMNEENRRGLEAALDSAKQRLEDITSWIEKNISDQESSALSKRTIATALGASSAYMRTVSAALDLVPNIFGMANGGMQIGAVPRAVAEGLTIGVDIVNNDALQLETKEMYRRRLNEWKVTKTQIAGEVKQLEAQVKADTIAQANLERQLAQYEAQVRQFDEQRTFMESRFTNEALYQWLTSQVSAFYYQAYDAVSALCLMTQEAWRYEMADYSPDKNFFSNGGWSNARRGLLAGETLRLGLLRMDQAYLSRTEQLMEIKHTFSVKELTTEGSLDKWKKTLAEKAEKADGAACSIPFTITEQMLAQRYPGHYQRQVVSVSVTLPCLIGPYEEVCAILVQKSGLFAVAPTKDAYEAMVERDPQKAPTAVIKKLRPSSAVALSSGLDDSGAFVLNFGDEKLLPFEGNGVVGEWELQIPNPKGELQQRMLKSLNDVIVTFRYRAKDGGEQYAQDVVAAVNKKQQENKLLED